MLSVGERRRQGPTQQQQVSWQADVAPRGPSLANPARSPAACTSPDRTKLELGRVAPPLKGTHNPWAGRVRAQQHSQQVRRTARPSRRRAQHPLPTGAYSLSE